MGVLSDAAVSRGDLMREIAELKARLDRVETARRMESASVGRGGFRVHDGSQDVFRVGAVPPELFLREDLLAPFAVAVLANRVHTGTTTAQAVYTSPTSGFVDHSQDAPATIPNVEVVAGLAIVTVSDAIGMTMASQGSTTGEVGVRIEGPTGVEPTFGRGVFLTVQGSDSGAGGWSRTQVHVLAPGVYTFDTRYRMSSLDSSPSVSFQASELSVIAL